MNERAIVFDCEGEELLGVLHEPGGVPRALGVLVLVGGPQYRVGSHRQFVTMARGLAEAGYCVLRFDYRGMGDSTGVRRGFDDVDSDIRAALNTFSQAHPNLSGFIVFGLCDAASSALMYCSSDARVQRLILANPWVHSETIAARTAVRNYYTRRFFQKSFWAKLFSGHLRASHSIREFLSSLRASSRKVGVNQLHFIERMRTGLAGFRGSVLVLLSQRDLTAREFENLCNASPEWKRCVVAPNIQTVPIVNADHTFSSAEARGKVLRLTLQWLDSAA